MSFKYTNRSSLIGNVRIIVMEMPTLDQLNNSDISHAEGLIPKEFGQDAVEIPGSRNLLEKLEEQAIPWCIVTSGTRPLVTGWLDVMR